jgi:hypothetical protein
MLCEGSHRRELGKKAVPQSRSPANQPLTVATVPKSHDGLEMLEQKCTAQESNIDNVGEKNLKPVTSGKRTYHELTWKIRFWQISPPSCSR